MGKVCSFLVVLFDLCKTFAELDNNNPQNEMKKQGGGVASGHQYLVKLLTYPAQSGLKTPPPHTHHWELYLLESEDYHNLGGGVVKLLTYPPQSGSCTQVHTIDIQVPVPYRYRGIILTKLSRIQSRSVPYRTVAYRTVPLFSYIVTKDTKLSCTVPLMHMYLPTYSVSFFFILNIRPF